MNKFINNFIYILIVITLCLVTFGITYAWFIMSRTSNNVNATSSGSLQIVYDKGQDVHGMLYPTTSKDNGLKASVSISQTSTSIQGLATISLNITTIDAELAISALKWELYANDGSNPVSTGNFANTTASSVINLVENYELSTTNTKFDLYIWLDGNESSNDVINKSFGAYISASAVNKPANVS